MIDITLHNAVREDFDVLVVGTPTQNNMSTYNMDDFIKKYVLRSKNPNAKVITFATHSWGTSYGHITIKDYMNLDVIINFKTQCTSCGRCLHICPKNVYMVQDKHFEQYEGFRKPIMEILSDSRI